VVAYSNKAKEAILKIPKLTLKTHGAVSRETALLMAKSVRKLAKSDFGIGITGIAGPGGATLKKLLGTVFIAICHNDQAICKEFRFSGRRTKIREKSAVKALELLGKSLRH
jgi:PncC family amidohydrolase